MRGKISSPGITGAITILSVPTTLKVGSEIRIKVDGDLYNYDYSWYDFWAGCITAERTGYHNHALFGGNGQVIGASKFLITAPTLSLGPMPVTPVLITVKLWGNPDFWVSWDWAAQGWVLADTRTVTIVPTGVPPTPPPECDTPGATQCFGADGTDLYTCVGGHWELTEANSPECAKPAPKGVGKWVAIGGGALIAALLLRKLR